MKKVLRAALAIILLTLAIRISTDYFETANGATFMPVRPVNNSWVGGQPIHTVVYAERHETNMVVLFVLSNARKPYRITSVEVFRYRYDGSKGAVRSYVTNPKTFVASNRVNLWRTIPARTAGKGWSGFVRMKLASNGETRVINLML